MINFSIFNNITDISYLYNDCRNMVSNPICSDKVTNMAFTYDNCRNLTGRPIIL